jgi:hypothetical protein
MMEKIMIRTSPALGVSLCALLLLSACGAPAAPAGSDTDAGSSPDSANGEPAPGAEFSSDDAGTGTITIGSVDYVGFEGECEFTADFGTALVTDPRADNVSLTLAVDNVESGEEPQLGVTAISIERFRLFGAVVNSGMFDDIEFAGPRLEGSGSDIALVDFAGSTESGESFTAQIVCVIDKP